MEGPSIFLAKEQLNPFVGKKVLALEGNTKIDKEKILNQTLIEIFSWGKHLVFQFDDFALRVHFLLFGSFEATVGEKKVTGDYPKKNRTPRLALNFSNGHIEMYSCSLRFLETQQAKNLYDYSIDIMSECWDYKKAFDAIISLPESEIGDVLLDQTIFAGVGNIIKNEVLFLVKILPDILVKNINVGKLREIIKTTRAFVFQFYEWRKNFVLRKHYQIYRRSYCSVCNEKVLRKRTGKWKRISYICPNCQKLT